MCVRERWISWTLCFTLSLCAQSAFAETSDTPSSNSPDESAIVIDGEKVPLPSAADPVDLDTNTPPPLVENTASTQETEQKKPAQEKKESKQQVEELDLKTQDQMIEEMTYLDQNRQWLSVGFGYVQNSGSYFAAGGVRYAITLLQRPLFERMHLQDSLAIEGGTYFYKALNFSVLSDSYLIANTIGTLRYNLLFSEDFGMFVYGGVFRNYAYATSQQSSAAIASQLSGQGVAGGIGFFFRIAPNWNTRIDLGTDIAGLSLMLRF